MPDYVKVEDSQIDFNSGVGQDTAFQGRDNQENLKERVTKIESQSRLFDHFIRLHSGGADLLSWGPNPASASFSIIEDWRIVAISNADFVSMNVAKPAQSVGRFAVQSGSEVRQLTSKHTLQYDQVTLPIIFECRVKLSADIRFWFGIYEPATDASPVTKHSIVLERVDGSNWRFRSYDGSANLGSSFTKITSGNWFKIKIEFTDTPSARAICSIDDVVKETLTANLPTAKALSAKFLFNGAIAQGDFDLDFADFGAVALSDAA